MDRKAVVKELVAVAKSVVSDRTPVCAECGAPIKTWAKQQGVLPATLISMILCRKQWCNTRAIGDAKQYLENS